MQMCFPSLLPHVPKLCVKSERNQYGLDTVLSDHGMQQADVLCMMEVLRSGRSSPALGLGRPPASISHKTRSRSAA